MIRFLFIICFLSLPFIYKEITHGFRANKLYLARKGETSQNNEVVASLLNQSFSYLGQGLQCFVFESDDGQVVLKLFNIAKRKSSQERAEKTLQACKLAFELAQEETGLLYIHLDSTDKQGLFVYLKNCLGISRFLSLDKYAFVIQKKAHPFKQTLLTALEQNRADPLIDSYLALIHQRSFKGICNTDVAIIRNFGFLGEGALEIDFGNYVYSPAEKAEEFQRFAQRMRRFVKKYAPYYLSRYDKKVAEYMIIDSSYARREPSGLFESCR
ncbi:MAG: hypothetical protein K2X08_04845 [Chlamydiales bacterium]|nr:hypothetical protein [Chlamydiales bacterium]